MKKKKSETFKRMDVKTTDRKQCDRIKTTQNNALELVIWWVVTTIAIQYRIVYGNVNIWIKVFALLLLSPAFFVNTSESIKYSHCSHVNIWKEKTFFLLVVQSLVITVLKQFLFVLSGCAFSDSCRLINEEIQLLLIRREIVQQIQALNKVLDTCWTRCSQFFLSLSILLHCSSIGSFFDFHLNFGKIL